MSLGDGITRIGARWMNVDLLHCEIDIISPYVPKKQDHYRTVKITMNERDYIARIIKRADTYEPEQLPKHEKDKP